MKEHLLLICTFVLTVHSVPDLQEKIANEMLKNNDDFKNTPTHKATKQELQDSYNQLMELENSPEDKAKMDQMMEKLAGITSGSSDSLATESKNETSDSTLKVEDAPKLKDDSDSKEARKLEVSDPTLGVPSPNASLLISNDDSMSGGSMGSSGDMDDKDSFKEDLDMNKDFGKDSGRKLNIGSMGGVNDLGAPAMDGGFNHDMLNMQNSYDNVNSMEPGQDTIGSGGSLNDLDSGMHQQETNAIINRMDQTNQQRMAKLNSMFPDPNKFRPKTQRKKKSHVISIKKMLKNYPPELVNQFMPELKEKVMGKFNQMRRERKEKERIRRLKRKLQRQKKRQRRRRKLREKRRRRELERRRRKRHHHHQHHRAVEHRRKWKPHFSLKQKHRKQFHSINVMNKFMHNRHNQLRRRHRLIERRLEENKSDSDSMKSFSKMEQEVLQNRDQSLQTVQNSNSEMASNSVNTNSLITGQSNQVSEPMELSIISDHDEDHKSVGSILSGSNQVNFSNPHASHISGSQIQSNTDNLQNEPSHTSGEMLDHDASFHNSPNQSTPPNVSVENPSNQSIHFDTESLHSGAHSSTTSGHEIQEVNSNESHHLDNESIQNTLNEIGSELSHSQKSSLNKSTFDEMESVHTNVNEVNSEHQEMHSTSVTSPIEITHNEIVSEHSGDQHDSNVSDHDHDQEFDLEAQNQTIKSEVSDVDSIEDSLEKQSQKADSLSSQLDQLEQMSNAGELNSHTDEEMSHVQTSHQTQVQSQKADESMFQHSVQSNQNNQSIPHSQTLTEHTSPNIHEEISSHPDQSYNSQPDETHQMSTQTFTASEHDSAQSVHVENVQQEPSHHSADVSELKFTKQEKPSPIMQDTDVDTVITDENDRPLTEGDKKIILEELEGKPENKIDMSISHKRIESLHHINVYHYLPPKFINAESAGFGYPGMVMPQQQQMTPGPIINIHNSTSSSGGNGGNGDNMYDVGPDGKLHSMAGQGAVVAQPTPTQNWGQVVYNNSHHGVHTVPTSTPNQIQVDSNPNNIQNQQPISLPKIEPVTMTNEQQPVTLPKIEPISGIDNQQPVILPKVNTVLDNQEPEIHMNDIKIDPVVNSEVIDKSPITIDDHVDHSSASNTSMTSENESNDSSHQSMHSTQEGFSMHSGDLDLHEVAQSHSNVSEEHDIFNPDELSNEDIETVHVDPEKVNDEDGQHVILGEDSSEHSADKSNVSNLIDPNSKSYLDLPSPSIQKQVNEADRRISLKQTTKQFEHFISPGDKPDIEDLLTNPKYGNHLKTNVIYEHSAGTPEDNISHKPVVNPVTEEWVDKSKDDAKFKPEDVDYTLTMSNGDLQRLPPMYTKDFSTPDAEIHLMVDKTALDNKNNEVENIGKLSSSIISEDPNLKNEERRLTMKNEQNQGFYSQDENDAWNKTFGSFGKDPSVNDNIKLSLDNNENEGFYNQDENDSWNKAFASFEKSPSQNEERNLKLDKGEASGFYNNNENDEWSKDFGSFGKSSSGNILDVDLKTMDPSYNDLKDMAPSSFSRNIDQFTGNPNYDQVNLLGGVSEDDLLNKFIQDNSTGFQDEEEDKKAFQNFEKVMNSSKKGAKKVPLLI